MLTAHILVNGLHMDICLDSKFKEYREFKFNLILLPLALKQKFDLIRRYDKAKQRYAQTVEQLPRGHDIEYVTCKEDIHELSYRQAEKGGLKRSTFIVVGSIFRLGYLILFLFFSYSNFKALRYDQEFLSLSFDSGKLFMFCFSP